MDGCEVELRVGVIDLRPYAQAIGVTCGKYGAAGAKQLGRSHSCSWVIRSEIHVHPAEVARAVRIGGRAVSIIRDGKVHSGRALRHCLRARQRCCSPRASIELKEHADWCGSRGQIDLTKIGRRPLQFIDYETEGVGDIQVAVSANGHSQGSIQGRCRQDALRVRTRIVGFQYDSLVGEVADV